MRRSRIIFYPAFGLAAVLAIGASYRARFSAERQLAAEMKLAQAESQQIRQDAVHFTEVDVPRGVAFSALLASVGIDRLTTAQLLAASRPVFNFRLLQAGNRLSLGRTVLGKLQQLRYQIDANQYLSILRSGEAFHAELDTVASSLETDAVAGKIDGSLFDAVTQAGETPEFAMRLADIFSWDLDFYTDPRPGDSFRAVVEKRVLANGKILSYGRILAAEYNNDGRIYRAVLFHDPAGRPAYYTPDGKSLKKAFLHSPLKFGAVVTSHFSYHRFHPILKYYRPHLGTDYAAPIGTPVQTIGDGRVVFAGRKGGAGNLIEIQHTNAYETYYMHLSRILVHAGQRVVQGQRIGLVGMTGLATGPHLDFRIERRGQFMNFERLPLPPANPVARRDWAEFAAVRDQEMGLMPQPDASFAATQPVGPPQAGVPPAKR
ncbi:MAG TPA: peptidoglycan DD-metalloendopeptidase family protein [Candidatus Acidoferrales bacterium]|nr:peptidoglycan DD-metalloendopeptidase family protein [Candidatus Acidoferrales bacterium]